MQHAVASSNYAS